MALAEIPLFTPAVACHLAEAGGYQAGAFSDFPPELKSRILG